MQNRLLRLFRFLLVGLSVLAEVGSILGRQYIPKFLLNSLQSQSKSDLTEVTDYLLPAGHKFR